MSSENNALPEQSADKQDPFIWLEGIREQSALEWAQQQNGRTVSQFATGDDFERVRQQVLTGLNSPAQIPGIHKCGNQWYNFWQDEKNPRGLLRRTTLDEYRKAEPAWETVLDIDALGKAEQQEWVYHGIQALKPDYRRALLHLSPDGGDASAIREFDLQTLSFVTDGFTLPAAKSRVCWIDCDRVFVSTYFGAGSMTTSGYPRITKIWQRGTPLSAAQTQFSAEHDDMMVVGYHSDSQGYKRNFVVRVIDFYRRETFLLDAQNTHHKVDLPQDAKSGLWREWLLVQPVSPWGIDGQSFPSGSLLAIKFDDFMAGDRHMTMLFMPGETTALSGFSMTRDYLILSVSEDVVNRLEILTPQTGDWLREPFGNAPAMSDISANGVDDDSNDYMMTVSSFLQPTTLYLGNLDRKDPPEILKQDPAHFDASGYAVSQHFAQSDDGTRVPYFLVAKKEVVLDGQNPTLLYGYGGFDVSLEPYYLGVSGTAWLDRGGVFVLANIRGGGEYGPRWHQAALKENRLRAYEDFAAVAKALVASNITSAQHLAAQGGSNGGLLVGNMLTLYPELFGAIVCEVPLLDMQRYTQISAGASWIAEYGDPQKPDEWAFIRAFSPYYNIDATKKYPPVLFTTATSDDRVGPGHARKMAAKMQALGIPEVWFYENTEGGHSAAADKAQSAFKRAMVSQFLLRFTGRSSR
ncbi:prolyl oligopeptidase family serine peptidase [Ewingella sp. S1.OA.A_B6]